MVASSWGWSPGSRDLLRIHYEHPKDDAAGTTDAGEPAAKEPCIKNLVSVVGFPSIVTEGVAAPYELYIVVKIFFCIVN